MVTYFHQPQGAAVLACYLGAGLFHTASDLLAGGWPENMPPWSRSLAVAAGAASWAFVCLRRTRAETRAGGWRAGTSYLLAKGLPPAALFAGGFLFAAASA